MGSAARSPGLTAAGAPYAFRTGDLDHARAETARLYYPLRIEPIGTSGSFGLDMITVLLETELTERLDRPMRDPLRFQLAMDTTAPGNQSWLYAVQMLAGELEMRTACHGEICRR